MMALRRRIWLARGGDTWSRVGGLRGCVAGGFLFEGEAIIANRLYLRYENFGET